MLMREMLMREPPVPRPAPSQPTIRLAEVPDGLPPYDSETLGPACRSTAPGPPRISPAPAAGAVPVTTLPHDTLAPTADSPGTARQFAQAIVETIAGTRPFRQVIPATTERVQAQIRGLIQLLRTDGKPRIRRILASSTNVDVVEVTVIASFGPRTRALAMRFEHLPARPCAPGLPPRPSRWLCTDLETP